MQRTLQTAADKIRTNLESIETTDPAVDEGALYLSASAAIFQMWASKIKTDQCLLGKDCTAVGLSKEDIENACDNNNECRKMKRNQAVSEMKSKDLGAYQHLLGRFLSESEKRLAESQDFQTVQAGRLRYITLYRILGD